MSALLSRLWTLISEAAVYVDGDDLLLKCRFDVLSLAIFSIDSSKQCEKQTELDKTN